MTNLKWWQKAVFYQIYPRSFADGNGDGIGDIQGMIERLDYLKNLGIDALWLSPHYPSPYADCGYDVADYTDVAPEYGTLDEFKRFLNEAHQRDIRIILDMVLNHSSDEHSWFLESRSSRDNPKRDWYVWLDGVNGGSPNNWCSAFGGSAWEYDSTTDQYYYHFFLTEQPDLNWHNPEVKQAMWDAIRFWLDMGVDGFRLDAIGTIFEDPAMPDHTSEMSQIELYIAFRTARNAEERAKFMPHWEAMYQYQVEQPGMHALMQELRTVINEYDDRLLVGESDMIEYYGDGSNELHLAFNFPLMHTGGRFTPAWIRSNQQERLSTLPPGAWPCNTLNNHDSSRVYNQFGDGHHDAALARLSLALMLTLRGTPFLYNGEEIGMTDLLLEDISQFYDTPAIWMYNLAVNEMGLPEAEVFPLVAQASRDRCRTPMQWANAPNGGFSPEGVDTWLPANPNYAEGVNVAEQLDDPDSLLNFYKNMILMRKRTPALIAGDYEPLHQDAEEYLAFTRSSEEQRCLVVLNYSDQSQNLSFDLGTSAGNLVFSNQTRDDTIDLTQFEVAPFEIVIAEIGD
ncbi:MAG: alpha-glucosidase [Chloroflexi bacterium]|nr:alpha-glucosidase [Chloroflexota bacterium]